MLHDMSSRKFDSSITQYMIYFDLGEFMLTANGRYTAERAYELYFANGSMSYEEWLEFLGQSHRHDIISEGNSLYFFQDLPVQYPSNSPAVAIVQLSKEKLLAPLTDIDWIDRGEFYIHDENGRLVLGNSSIAYEDLVFKNDYLIEPGDRETVYSRMRDNNGWTYTLIMNADDFAASVSPIDGVILTVFILCVAIGLWLVGMFTLRNYSPIRSIVMMFDNYRIPVTAANQNEYTLIRNSVEMIINKNISMESQVALKNELIRQNYLGRLLADHSVLTNTSEEQMRENGLELPHENIRLACFQIIDFSEYYEEISNSSEEYPTDKLYSTLLQQIKSLLAEIMVAYVCESEGLLVALMNYDALSDKEIIELLSGIQIRIQKSLLISLNVYLSQSHKSIYALHQAGIEVHRAMHDARRKQNEKAADIFVFTDELQTHEYIYSNEMEQALYNNLLLGNKDSALNIVSELFAGDKAEFMSSYNLFKAYIMDITITLIRAGESVGITLEALSPSVMIDESSRLNNSKEAMEFFERHITLLCDAINDSKESHSNGLLDSITAYINENYKNVNLDNTMIAEAVGISPAYLSRFFKQQTGDGVTRYIGNLRIAAAKDLLCDDTPYTVAEVSAMVGIDNVATFIRLFKKSEGITPGQYQSIRQASLQ